MAGHGWRVWWRPTLALAVLAGLAQGAWAATLIEATTPAGALRFVIDRQQDRVRLDAGGTTLLFDFPSGSVYLGAGPDPARRVRARFRPGYHEPPPYRSELYGPGPIVAGHATDYHVLFVGEQVCAEVLPNAWMAPFVDPAVRALGLLQELAPPSEGDPCATIPFTTYAAAGWPLLAGRRDRPALATTTIRFDYRPGAEELAPPALFEEAGWDALTPLAWLVR